MSSPPPERALTDAVAADNPPPRIPHQSSHPDIAHSSPPAAATPSTDAGRRSESAAKSQSGTLPDASSSQRPRERHDPRPAPPPDLSRSPSASAKGASRLSSSFFPALAKARLALSAAAASSSSPPPPAPAAPAPRDMRSSSARDAQPKPKPLLVLKLSSSSYLDTIIRDDKSKDPVYILETVRELTNIYRLDHPRDEPVKAATVQWPLHPVRIKGKSGRSIQFGHGSWREAEDLLKNGPLGSTAIRKFSIPHYPNSLKWKLIPGNCFCCVTSAVKGPVAVLDAATLSAPPRLKVYHPLIERDVARSQDNYKGIPTVFLDYLIVTSLLLVTDVQEWLDRPREARIPGSSSYTIQRWLALIHDTPAPPEPDHPTVDLSLTVPSTPPQSATFPSPGGFWETQSGVTSLSGSNGSGSGASYTGEPFTPTTPATPVTSATSANSSTFFSRSAEDAPPVPPVPGGSSSSASPFAHNAEPARVRERPKSNPQAMTHAANPSSSRGETGSPSNPFPANGSEESSSSQSRSRSAHTLSLPGGGDLGLPSTSAPTSPLPNSGFSSASSSSSRPGRRQLPVPPGPVPANSFAQPWLYASGSSAPSSSNSASSASPSSPQSANSAARAARASMRGSLRTIPIPPPPPPPQHSIPLPPKLAQEQQGYGSRSGLRPRTAPELESGNRRRHSESFAPGQFGEPSPSSPVDDSTSSMHPYAAAAANTYSLRGREVSEREMRNLVSQMRGLSASPGPSSLGESRVHTHMNHIRAPSQPAPDYDTHSFVNMPPPPLPVPPASSSGAGSRPPPRRQLTVVNADPIPQPTAADSVGGAATGVPVGLSACPPPPGDLRLDPRMSYADSVYEMPPPAYDAIDFSVQFVPAVPSIPSHLTVVPAGPPPPLPVPPADVSREAQRSS